MKPQTQIKISQKRAGERGAALVTMLLSSILILGAGGALIATTMMSATNSMNSTAEMQAYYVAESGMQSALNVLRGNLATLPLRDGSVDVVANLQVIEHLWDQEGFLAECRRVLRPGGTLIVTTPNRLTFSPGQDTPLNPFHTRELAPSELDEMLREAGFRVDELAGLRHGPRLDSLLNGQIIDAQVEVALSGEPWPAELKEAVESVTVQDFDITSADMDTCLDLVAVAVRA